MATLEELTDELDAACIEILGDTIKYTPDGGAQRELKAHVDYEDGQVDIGAGQLIEQDITVHIRKADIPAKPSSAVRMILPKHPNITYRPANVASDRSGTHWAMSVVLP